MEMSQSSLAVRALDRIMPADQVCDEGTYRAYVQGVIASDDITIDDTVALCKFFGVPVERLVSAIITYKRANRL